VKGKVTYKGEPVKGGSVVFSPLSEGGKAASSEIQQDGTYTLSTNRPGDGVKPGRYRVTFTPPPGQEAPASVPGKPPPKAIPNPYAGLVPKPDEVDVKSGDNSVNLELVKPGT